MEYQAALNKIKALPPSRVVMFIGAGFCLDLNYPSWWGLIQKLQDFVSGQFAPHGEVMKHRIKAGDVIGAADPAYAKEISSLDRARFLKAAFPRPAELKRRHRLLGNLPVAAFVTTNFDEVIELAIQQPKEERDSRLPVTFSGSDRFRRFNSELSLYRDEYHLHHQERALVLKIHNDVSDVENLILNTRSMEELPKVDGYRTFYENLFRQYSVVFLGFGGNDPNLLEIIAKEVGSYAGYMAVESFLFLAEGTPAPPQFDQSPHFHVVHYSPANNHAQIESLLDSLNTTWTSPTVQDRIRAAKAFEDAAPDEDSTVSIFDLMIPAFRGNVDKTVVQRIELFMVQTGINSAHTSNPKSVANQVAQKFGLSKDHSRRLVEDHIQTLSEEGRVSSPSISDLITPLALGVLTRAHAFDGDFLPQIADLKPMIRSTFEGAMKAYGGNVALSILRSERPSRIQLSETIRNTIRNGHWQKIGPHEKEVVEIAVADLFMEPSKDEAEILSKLSVTAVAFGIIQAFPDTNLSDVVLPSKLYLDANCVLPAIVHIAPRSTALMHLISELRALRRPVLFLKGFLDEIRAHYEGARRLLVDNNISTIGDARKFVSSTSSIEEFVNAFLLALVKSDCDITENALKFLTTQFDPNSFGHLVEGLGIKVVEGEAPPKELSALRTMILNQKKQWYGRSLAARDILAKHEALQLLVMQRELSSGEKPWFATDDSQLRRIVRGNAELDRLILLPVSGIASLVTATSNGSQFSSIYPRLLWNPDWGDQADAVIAKALRELLPKIDPNVRLPLAEARDLAIKEFMNRADAPNDSSSVYQSVFAYLGKAIFDQK